MSAVVCPTCAALTAERDALKARVSDLEAGLSASASLGTDARRDANSYQAKLAASEARESEARALVGELCSVIERVASVEYEIEPTMARLLTARARKAVGQ